MGCGGCLVAVLLLLGALGGAFYFMSKGPVDAVRAQLQQIRAGQHDAAYDRLAPRYREQVTPEAFAAFVARHPGLKDNADSTFLNRSVSGPSASLSGYLTAADGAREVASFELVRDRGEWKIARMEVGSDRPEALAAGGPRGLRIESVEAQKRAVGNTIEVAIGMNVTGFDVRPEQGQYAIDLAVDVETTGPAGERIEALSRDEVQRFRRTTSMETGAVAPITTTLTVDRSLPEGAYVVRLRVRDLVGGGQAAHQVTFALP